MSKSKLNKRQLKKISKLAMYAVVKEWDVDLSNMGYCEETGEYWHGWQCFEDFDERTCVESLDIAFNNAWCDMTKEHLIANWNEEIFPKECYSLSFANKIHYMVKFLEGKQ